MSDIDWNTIDVNSERAWSDLAERLMTDARAALESRDENHIAQVMDDILDYAAQPSAFKPVAAARALDQTQVELGLAKTEMANAKLAEGDAQFDQIIAGLSSTAATLHAGASHLNLETVRAALNVADEILTQVNAVEAELKALSKNDLAGRFDAIVTTTRVLIDQLTVATR